MNIVLVLTSITAYAGENDASQAAGSITATYEENKNISVPERPLNNDVSEGIPEVNVLDFGADPKGVRECTSVIKRAHNTGKRVFYPNGIYRFNGKNLDFSGGVRFESPDGVIIHNDISMEPIINFDDFGNLIGLQQNHLESYRASDGKKMTTGNLVSPPESISEFETKADMLVYWYNDFGLEKTRLAGNVSWGGWYTWEWNYHDKGETDMSDPSTYWPERHPLLGFYRGDDTTVLDWQCYWLKEYGVKGVVITASGLDDWENPATNDYWVHQLFYNTKNFKNLKFAIMMPARWIGAGDEIEKTRAEIRMYWKNSLEKTYFNPEFEDQVYYMEINGGKYPLLSVFEELQIPGMCDFFEGGEHSAEFYKEIAELFREHGWDGFALDARHWDERIDPYNEELKKAGVYRFWGAYETSNVYGDPGCTYEEFVDSFAPIGRKDEILHVFTGANTHSPHPSCWVHPGNSPELFEKLINKVVDYIEQNDMPRVITCYNMAEWAEGGPGLQPVVGQRFAYLDAIKNALVEK